MLPLHVPTDTFSLVITGLQCLNLGAFANEMKAPTPYSKFAADLTAAGNKAVLPSRQGMLCIYLPALCTSVACLATAPGGNGREVLVGSLLVAHFAKRVMETLFVHEYSGNTSAAVAGFIGVYYALTSLLVLKQQAGVPSELYATGGSDATLAIGLAAFAVGQAGNYYHHVRLAWMRRQPASSAVAVPKAPTTATALALEQPVAQRSKYMVPTGGLFDLVTMPHYLFEIIAWFGIAMCCQQLNAVLVALGMTSYLSGRAVATTQWYKERFGKEWPSERRNLVPYVF